MKKRFSRKLGHRLRKIRLSKELTQQELADKMNVHLTTIGKIESGSSTPSLMMLNKFLNALDLDLFNMLDSYLQ